MQARFISDLWCLVSMNLKRKKSTLGGFIYRLQNSPYFCVFKYARAAKQKVWNEAENRERDCGETLEILFSARARKTLTLHFTDYAALYRFLYLFLERNRQFCFLCIKMSIFLFSILSFMTLTPKRCDVFVQKM